MAMEGGSVLDRKASHVFGFPLTIRQQVWFGFLLSSLSLLLIYIADVSTDITMALLLLGERLYLQAGLTLAIVYTPPLLTYLARLSRPPDTKEVKVVFAWFFTETAAFVIFPIRILQCIGERVFWSIEALRLEDPEREEALEEYEKTRCKLIENLLFTQAYLQAVPQAILQALLVVYGVSDRIETRSRHDYQPWAEDETTYSDGDWRPPIKEVDIESKEIMQVACVLTSIATIALVTSCYERYQRQVGGGRYQVWSPISPEPTKAMDTDNPVGSLVSFAGWFFFLVARITAIALAFYFYPRTVSAIIGAHFLLCLLYLLSIPPQRLSKLFLSFVYIFCIVEVQIQLRKTKIFYAIYFALTTTENIAITVLWCTQTRWSGTFYKASIYIIIISKAISLLSFLIYHIFLKPKARRIDG